MLRGLSAEGVAIAGERGLLFCADTEEGRTWVITDSRRLIAQARRMDGKPFEHIGGHKAWTLPGSIGALPIGLYESLTRLPLNLRMPTASASAITLSADRSNFASYKSRPCRERPGVNSKFGHIFELLEIVSNVFIAQEWVPVRRKTGAIIGGTLASGNVVTHSVADREGRCGLES